MRLSRACAPRADAPGESWLHRNGATLEGMSEAKRRTGLGWRERLARWVSRWLATDVQPRSAPRTDFVRLSEHLRPADVVLVAGRSRVAGVIQTVTLSSWSHAALYIGRADTLAEGEVRRVVVDAGWPPDTQILLEAEMGDGVRVSPLTRYRGEHLRICRPRDMPEPDRAAVINYACARYGTPYDTRQILDLLRFFLPYGILPRHWRSTLFEAGHGDMIRAICSTLLANAFALGSFAGRWFAGGGKNQFEESALPVPGAGRDTTTVLFGDPSGQKKSITAALLLGREARLEDFFEIRSTQPGALVANPHSQLPFEDIGFEQPSPRPLHGLNSVAQEDDQGFSQG